MPNALYNKYQEFIDLFYSKFGESLKNKTDNEKKAMLAVVDCTLHAFVEVFGDYPSEGYTQEQIVSRYGNPIEIHQNGVLLWIYDNMTLKMEEGLVTDIEITIK